MKHVSILALLLAVVFPCLALGQKADKGARNRAELEKELWDADQQWLGAGPHKMSYRQLVAFRHTYWADQFFEVSSQGKVQTREQMLAQQDSHPAPDSQRIPSEFKLWAVYGNFALATDHTVLKNVSYNGARANGGFRVLRLFVFQNGKWRPAAGALIPDTDSEPATPAGQKSAGEDDTPSSLSGSQAELEKQLAAADQKWMDGARTKDTRYLQQFFTSQWAEIIPWYPKTLPRPDVFDLIQNQDLKPGQGVFPDQFKLRALYGDVALATDRRTRKWTDANGRDVFTPHRGLVVFVRENRTWKPAGGALVAIRNQ